MAFETIIETPNEKEWAMDYIRESKGAVRIKMSKAKSARADRLLRGYFPHVVKPLADRLRAIGNVNADGTPITDDQVDYMLRGKVLKTAVVDRNSEIIGWVFPRSENLSDDALADYIDRAAVVASELLQRTKALPVSAGAA